VARWWRDCEGADQRRGEIAAGSESGRAAAHAVGMSIQDSPGSAISPTIANPLRLAILASPTYRFLRAHPGTPYENNGVRL